MLDFMRKSRGAISIFLIIVLLPMLSVASIFVDTGRLKLASAMAESAGDLTLNTVLTDYDSTLKNMYGLFATSQSIDEMLLNLEEYYKAAIEAAGVDGADADDYVDQIMGYLRTSTGTDDLMNIELSDFQVKAPTGGNLANPAILKSQIVEFMKYRAPLSLGTSFIDALSCFKNMDKQEDLVDDKTKFYEEQKTVMEDLEAAWRQIQLYQYCYVNQMFPTGNYITNNGNILEINRKADLHAAISDTVMYQYYSYVKPSQYAVVLNDNKTADDSTDDYWTFNSIKLTPEYSEDDKATFAQVKGELQTVLAAIRELEAYYEDEGYKYLAQTDANSDIVRRVYAVTYYNRKVDNVYKGKVERLLKSLVDLESALNNCSEQEKLQKEKYRVVNGILEKNDKATGTIATIAKSQLQAHLINPATGLNPYGGKGSSTGYLQDYLDMMSKIMELYNKDLSTVSSKKTQITNKLTNVVNDSSTFYKFIDARIGNLSKAITSLGKVKTAMSEGGSYDTALDNWKGSADELSEETIGKNDLSEIEKVKASLKVEDINGLINRLTAAKTVLENIRDKIASYKFEGTSWKDISTFSNGASKIKQMLTQRQKTSIEGIMPESAASYTDVINQIKDTVTGNKIVGERTDWTDQNSPDLRKNQHRMYTWLYNNYYIEGLKADSAESTTTEVDKGEAELEKNKKQLEEDANKHSSSEAPSTKVEIDLKSYFDLPEEAESLPSIEWTGIKATIAEGAVQTNQDELLASETDAGSILGDLLKVLANGVEGLRDDLYVSEYIMNMFTYATYEAELTKEYNKNKGTDTSISAWYTKNSETNKWELKEDYKAPFSTALSLTNNPLTPNDNHLYGSEVEYIIYGWDDTIDYNLKTKGTIFLIRFALNSVYAFTDAEINNTTMAAATALFGTPPLTPLIPIAKVAMIIGLAIAESSYDLYMLMQGEEVPIIKNSSTWIMKPSSAGKKIAAELAEEIADKAIDKVIDEGYKVLSDALEKTDEELQAMIEQGTLNISELAKSTVNSTFDKLQNYANEAVQELVAICNEVNQEFMYCKDYDPATQAGATPEKVTEVIKRLKEWRTGQQGIGEEIVYEVKNIAVDYLLENSGERITTILNKISEVAGKEYEVLSQELDGLKTDIRDRINELADQLGSKLNGFREKAMEDIQNAAKEGAEKLRSTLKGKVGDLFGSSSAGVGTTNTVVSSLMSWQYSDYLRLFLLVALIASDEGVMLRMADVIELNMQQMNGEFGVVETTTTKTVSRFFGLIKYQKETTVVQENSKAFKLSKAYTYLTISATLEVKPLLMAMPFMADTTEQKMDGTKWYEIQYTGTLGY